MKGQNSGQKPSVSCIVEFEFLDEGHEWEGKNYWKTWKAIVTEMPICKICKRDITRDELAFFHASSVPGKLRFSETASCICKGCYSGQYPGRVAVIDYEE